MDGKKNLNLVSSIKNIMDWFQFLQWPYTKLLQQNRRFFKLKLCVWQWENCKQENIKQKCKGHKIVNFSEYTFIQYSSYG